MSPPGAREISHGLYGAWRLALFDGSAMAWFDRSVDGVWRSFWALAIAYPGIMVLVVLRVMQEEPAPASLGRVLLVESIGYVIGCAAFPLAMLYFCRWLERERQWLDLIAAYNWAQLLQTMVLVVVAVPLDLGLVSDGVSALVTIVETLALIAYEWFIARTALDAGGVAAAAVVLIDLVLSFGLGAVTRYLY